MHRISQLLSHLYNLCAGHYQLYGELKQFSPIVLICVETKWPGSVFAMAVLGCRSLVLANNNNDNAHVQNRDLYLYSHTRLQL